jgi:pantothenate kinase
LQIAIFEGLYLLYDKDNHAGVSKFWDFSIFIESDIEKCIARLKERNKCIPG